MKKSTLFALFAACFAIVLASVFSFAAPNDSKSHPKVYKIELNKTANGAALDLDLSFGFNSDVEFYNFSYCLVNRKPSIGIYFCSIKANNKPLGNTYLLNYNKQKTC